MGTGKGRGTEPGKEWRKERGECEWKERGKEQRVRDV